MKFITIRKLKTLCVALLLFGFAIQAQESVTGQIGTGTSNALSLYGPMLYITPIQRQGSVSNQLYTQAELAAIGISAGDQITSLGWKKLTSASSQGYPAVRMRILMANSNISAPLDPNTTYADIEATHTEVYDNEAYMLPATIGWINFELTAPFTYTGGTLEVATAMYVPWVDGQNTASFTSFVSWEYTPGYTDYMIGAWPIYMSGQETQDIDMNVPSTIVLSHNSGGGQYKQRPNIQLTYTTVPQTTPPATWQNVGPADVVSAGGSSFNNLAVDAAGNYFLSYYDLSVSKGSVQQFNGTAWSYTGGSAGITSGSATYNSLSLDALGNVFYSNQLSWPGSGLEVRQFNGTSWSPLTNATTASVNYQASAVSPSNVLFTYSNDGSGTVRRLVNGMWEQVGNAGFSGGATFAEMVIGSNNMVYTCNVAGGNAQVYANSVTAAPTDNWALAGGTTVGAAASSEQYTSDIAIDAANNLYVAYVSNAAGGNKLNVKKFNGTEWMQLGEANFSAGKVQHVAIAVSSGGQVYVIASRWENDNMLRNTAYAFNAATNAWTAFGGDFISDGQATYNDLVTDNINHYLVLAYSQSGTRVKRIAITEDEESETGCANTEPGLNPGDTGCVSFSYNGQVVSYTTVRGEDGNIWLQQNLGAEGVATAMDEEAAYGDLYQWGRWADGHQKRTSAITGLPAPNNPDGLGTGLATYITASPGWWNSNALTDTWTAETPEAASDIDGCDPCKALGQGWAMPTQANWEALVAAEEITNPASAFASNLKLPANGYRSSSDGGFTFMGQRGYYWSATTSATGAKYLYVGTTVANPGAGAPRGQGAAVRCIKMAPQQVQQVMVSTQNNVPATITTAGGTLQLVAVINPAAVSQSVTWGIASGSEFATVDANGLVTATANGTVVVRATSVADTTKFGEIEIVINYTVAVESLEVTTQNNVAAEITVIDGTLQLIATITPGNANEQDVTWSIVSGSGFATVDTNGLVTATANGTVAVRAASAEDDAIFDEITLTITNQLTCQELHPGATEPITLVNFAGINNESAAAVGGAFTESFMQVTGTAQRGEAYTLTVKGNTNGNFAHTVTAYIDWNLDMDFSDEGETYEVGTLQNTTGTDAAQVTVSITVPEDATLGIATLRISKRMAEGEIECNPNLYGQTEYYTLAVTETASAGEFNMDAVSVYPNPVADVLHIEANQEVVLAEVFTTLGQRVLATKGNAIHASGLANGVYIVRVALQNGTSQNIKIIKQ
jgi:hypothetical protein